MRATSKLLALTLAAALQPAMAGMVTLDFEDITTVTQIGNRYGDVKFTSDALGVTADDQDTAAVCKGDILFEPRAKPTRNCAALLNKSASAAADAKFTISSDLGFVDAVSFAYALRDGAAARIDIYGDGDTWLAGTDLGGGVCKSSFLFCNWQTPADPILKFSGVARSFVISSTDQRLMIDDLAFTTAAATGTLPEPSSIVLAFGALGALGWTRKRAAR